MVFPGQILRNKEGEVVTEEQIKKYEAEMRAKGVGTGGVVVDAKSPEKDAPSVSTKAAASEKPAPSAGKTSSAASKSDSKAAAKKEIPGDLF